MFQSLPNLSGQKSFKADLVVCPESMAKLSAIGGVCAR